MAASTRAAVEVSTCSRVRVKVPASSATRVAQRGRVSWPSASWRVSVPVWGSSHSVSVIAFSRVVGCNADWVLSGIKAASLVETAALTPFGLTKMLPGHGGIIRVGIVR